MPMFFVLQTEVNIMTYIFAAILILLWSLPALAFDGPSLGGVKETLLKTGIAITRGAHLAKEGIAKGAIAAEPYVKKGALVSRNLASKGYSVAREKGPVLIQYLRTPQVAVETRDVAPKETRDSARERISSLKGVEPSIPFPPHYSPDRYIRRVCLDPGHGGEDAGAVGFRGLREKDVTLDVAKRFKRILEAEGYEVMMTREGDYFIPLNKRVEKINGSRCDIMISIHADASKNREGRGITTYINRSFNPRAKLGHNSILLADIIQRNLVDWTDGQDRGIQTGGFYVLRKTRVPGVLVETSFISNPLEELKLSSKKYCQDIAESLFEAVDQIRPDLDA